MTRTPTRRPPVPPAALDRDLLARYARYGPISFADLFEGLSPAWAAAAHARLLGRGLIEVTGTQVVVTHAGDHELETARG